MKWETMFRWAVCACLLVASCGMDPTKPEAEKRGDGWSRPMADKTTIWYGTSGDGDWETAGNWSNGQPSTTGDNDTVIVSRYATSGMTTNLDRTADNTTGQQLSKLYVERGCNVAIGSRSNPLKLQTIEMQVLGSTGFYYTHESDSGALSDMVDCIFQAPTGTPIVFDVGATADAITRVYCGSGYITFKSTIPDEAIGTLYIGGGTGPDAPFVQIEDPSSTDELCSSRFEMTGGTVFTGRRLAKSSTGVFSLSGGALEQINGSNGDFQVSPIMYVSGGRMNVRTDTTASMLVQSGGVVDLTDAGQFTLSRYVRTGGTILYDPFLVTITGQLGM